MIKPTDHHITSSFADYTWNDYVKRTVPHAGVDYGHQGMVYFAFVAPNDGVILSTNGRDSFILDCPQEYETSSGVKIRFQHQFVHINKANLPRVGASFKQGQVICKSGDSDGKAKPHLHWTCIVKWPGNNALCDGGRFVDSGEVWVSKNENGLQSWYLNSSWAGVPKNSVIPLKLLFKLKEANTSMDTVIYKGQTFGRDDVARIISNLSGKVGTYDWEFEKFRKDPVTAVFDWIGWKDYKNETAKQSEQKDKEWQAKTDLLNKRILDDSSILEQVKLSNEKRGLEISDLKASISGITLDKDNLLNQVNVLEQNNKDISEKFTGTIEDRKEQISNLTEFKVDVLEGSKGLLIGAVISAILGLLALLFRGKDQKSEKLQKLFIVLALLAVVAGVCFFIYKVFSGGI